MDPAVKGNVLLYLSAMCLLGAFWVGVGAFGEGGIGYALMAVLLSVASVVAFRAYRSTVRDRD